MMYPKMQLSAAANVYMERDKRSPRSFRTKRRKVFQQIGKTRIYEWIEQDVEVDQLTTMNLGMFCT